MDRRVKGGTIKHLCKGCEHLVVIKRSRGFRHLSQILGSIGERLALDKPLQQGLGVFAKKLFKFRPRPSVTLSYAHRLDMPLDSVPQRGGDFTLRHNAKAVWRTVRCLQHLCDVFLCLGKRQLFAVDALDATGPLRLRSSPATPQEAPPEFPPARAVPFDRAQSSVRQW